MSEYYTPRRTTRLYDPSSKEPFALSRSKIDLFLECPRCCYLDRRLGVGRVPGFPFSLNSAVDHLLKQEFDAHRAAGSKHPLIEKYGVDARPIPHENLNEWRHNFTGVRHHHAPTNFIVFGAIDDLWQNDAGEHIVVDYKATAKAGDIVALDQDWHRGYKRQMEVYQWLLRRNGLTVSSTGYFVYCNGITDRAAFDARLDFKITLIPYAGNDSWVEGALTDAHACLAGSLPAASNSCDWCTYVAAVNSAMPAPTRKPSIQRLPL